MSAGNLVEDVYAGLGEGEVREVREIAGLVKKALADVSSPLEGVLKARMSLRKARADPEGGERAEKLAATLEKKSAALEEVKGRLEALAERVAGEGAPDACDPPKREMIAFVLATLEGNEIRSRKDFLDFTATVRSHTQAVFKEMGALLTLIKALAGPSHNDAYNDDHSDE